MARSMPRRRELKAMGDITISFKKLDNLKGPGDDEVEFTVKPEDPTAISALVAAGFTKGTGNVYAINRVDMDAAKAAFLAEAAKHGLAVEEESEHVMVVRQGAPVSANLMAAGNWEVVPCE